MSFQEPGTYHSGLALGKSGGSLDVGPVMDDVGVRVRSPRAQATTPYLPRSVGGELV